MQDSVRNIIYNDDGVDPYGRFFEKQTDEGYCGLYAIRNLLETRDVTAAHLHEAAQQVATLTKDDIKNHADSLGFWSLDAISLCLATAGFDVNYESSLSFLSKNIVGYLVHLPQRFHYISVRRSKRMPGKFEVCDSQSGISTTTLHELQARCVKEKWNIISVSVF